MSRLDDLFGEALAPRPVTPRKSKPTRTEEQSGALASLGPWTPPVREPYPPRALTSGRQRPLPEYVSPRDRPELSRRCPGPGELSEADVAAWTAVDPFVREGLSYATRAALAYIETFRPRASA